MEYSLAWSFASLQGLYWDLKFRSSASAYRIVCDLELWNGTIPLPNKENIVAWKLRSSASIQWIKYYLKFRSSASIQELWLKVPQFRLRTKNILWLEVQQFRFRTRNTLCLEVQQFCFRTKNNLWLEIPQFRTIYCDLNYRSSASARKDVIWNSALLLLHENVTFLWKTHSHSTTHPFLNFHAVLHEWWTLWSTEKQRNRDALDKSRR